MTYRAKAKDLPFGRSFAEALLALCGLAALGRLLCGLLRLLRLLLCSHGAKRI